MNPFKKLHDPMPAQIILIDDLQQAYPLLILAEDDTFFKIAWAVFTSDFSHSLLDDIGTGYIFLNKNMIASIHTPCYSLTEFRDNFDDDINGDMSYLNKFYYGGVAK